MKRGQGNDRRVGEGRDGAELEVTRDSRRRFQASPETVPLSRAQKRRSANLYSKRCEPEVAAADGGPGHMPGFLQRSHRPPLSHPSLTEKERPSLAPAHSPNLARSSGHPARRGP